MGGGALLLQSLRGPWDILKIEDIIFKERSYWKIRSFWKSEDIFGKRTFFLWKLYWKSEEIFVEENTLFLESEEILKFWEGPGSRQDGGRQPWWSSIYRKLCCRQQAEVVRLRGYSLDNVCARRGRSRRQRRSLMQLFKRHPQWWWMQDGVCAFLTAANEILSKTAEWCSSCGSVQCGVYVVTSERDGVLVRTIGGESVNVQYELQLIRK